MKIYTKTGDGGETGLFAGPRVPKDHCRIVAYGEVDELNCVLGVARAEPLSKRIDDLVCRIQHELFAVGAELATPDPQAGRTDYVGETQVQDLEAAIDQFDARLLPLKQFILPSGSKAAAHLHLARAVCRRCERRVVALARADDTTISISILQYLNRLSDLLFVFARSVNAEMNCPDTPWQKPARTE